MLGLRSNDREQKGTGVERITVSVPVAFWDDHKKRGCVEYSPDCEQSRKGSRVTVSLDPRDLADLYSDARHYASSGVSVYGWDLAGLVSSARATVKALVQQGHGK